MRHAGLIQAHQFATVAQNGISALREAGNLLRPGLINTLDAGSNVGAETRPDTERLLQMFQRQFPEGWCHQDQSVLTHRDVKHLKLPNSYYSTFLHKLTTALRSPCDLNADNELSISVAFPHRGAPLIFVIPYSYENKTSAIEWKKNVYGWNVGQNCWISEFTLDLQQQRVISV